jgi:hypothetical protein
MGGIEPPNRFFALEKPLDLVFKRFYAFSLSCDLLFKRRYERHKRCRSSFTFSGKCG